MKNKRRDGEKELTGKGKEKEIEKERIRNTERKGERKPDI